MPISRNCSSQIANWNCECRRSRRATSNWQLAISNSRVPLLLLCRPLRLDAVGDALAVLADVVLVLGVGQVVDVHPRVSHLIDRAVAIANPLVGIGVALVPLGVVVPGD